MADTNLGATPGTHGSEQNEQFRKAARNCLAATTIAGIYCGAEAEIQGISIIGSQLIRFENESFLILIGSIVVVWFVYQYFLFWWRDGATLYQTLVRELIGQWQLCGTLYLVVGKSEGAPAFYLPLKIRPLKEVPTNLEPGSNDAGISLVRTSVDKIFIVVGEANAGILPREGNVQLRFFGSKYWDSPLSEEHFPIHISRGKKQPMFYLSDSNNWFTYTIGRAGVLGNVFGKRPFRRNAYLDWRWGAEKMREDIKVDTGKLEVRVLCTRVLLRMFTDLRFLKLCVPIGYAALMMLFVSFSGSTPHFVN